MRKAAFIATLAALGAVAGCSETSQQVAATQPTVAYQVTGSNLAQANADAGRYCSQFGMAARLYNTQPRADGQIASYDCVAGSAGAVYGSDGTTPAAAYQPYTSGPVGTPITPAAPVYAPTAVSCADFLHQARPGGSDYQGPPVAGCPQS